MRIPSKTWLSRYSPSQRSSHSASSQPKAAKTWAVSTPEKLGLDANVLAALDADIVSGKYGNTDRMLVIRHGQIAYDRAYTHDYGKLYGEQARKTGGLNAHDFGGPYNYFNPFWHPYYRRGELHTLQSITKTVTSVSIALCSSWGCGIQTSVAATNETRYVKYRAVDRRYRFCLASGHCTGILTGAPEIQAAVT